MTISRIDIGKNTFQLHGADDSGRVVYKTRLSRRELAAQLANLPACTIVIESCGGANYRARVLQRSGVQSHQATRVRERGMRKFKSIRQAQTFVSAHAAVSNLFNPGRNLVRAHHYRYLRVSAFNEWNSEVA